MRHATGIPWDKRARNRSGVFRTSAQKTSFVTVPIIIILENITCKNYREILVADTNVIKDSSKDRRGDECNGTFYQAHNKICDICYHTTRHHNIAHIISQMVFIMPDIPRVAIRSVSIVLDVTTEVLP